MRISTRTATGGSMNPDEELRQQVIQELREQRERRGIFGSIPEWIIEIKIREKKAQQEAEAELRGKTLIPATQQIEYKRRAIAN